jgi:exosortase J
LHFTRLQAHAELADYIIGFCLFTLAAGVLFLVVSKSGKRPPEPAPPARTTVPPRSFYLRFAVMTVLLLLLSFRYATGLVRHPLPPPVAAVFPQQIGSYTLSRRWQERYLTGQIIYEWAQYDSAGSTASNIQLGVSPVLGAHDTLLCHVARGEDPIWQGPVSLQQAGNLSDSFNASLYNDGVSQFIELTTQCGAGICGEYSNLNGHFGFIYSVPASANLIGASIRPVPILLRVETLDPTLAPEVARRLLLAEMQTFLAHADLPSLSKQFQTQ